MNGSMETCDTISNSMDVIDDIAYLKDMADDYAYGHLEIYDYMAPFDGLSCLTQDGLKLDPANHMHRTEYGSIVSG